MTTTVTGMTIGTMIAAMAVAAVGPAVTTATERFRDPTRPLDSADG
jgi:hypothetical protein